MTKYCRVATSSSLCQLAIIGEHCYWGVEAFGLFSPCTLIELGMAGKETVFKISGFNICENA